VGKRWVDVAGSLALLVFALPVIALSAFVSAATFRAWPFFVQQRIGRHGRPFRLVKVRTLSPGTPTQLAKPLLVAHEPPWACRFLRSHHIDELPQLVQVLTGTMSLVGPRPEMPLLVSQLSPEQARARDDLRPGITGLWQVSTAVRGMIADDPSFDVFYAAQRTGRMDAWIVWRTLAALVGVEPIASVADVPSWTRRRAQPAGPGLAPMGGEGEAGPVHVGSRRDDPTEVVEAASSPAS
jgi:lipopolysaccharide/colanic/teichoic acid biosynthesis glycosyltransferase